MKNKTAVFTVIALIIGFGVGYLVFNNKTTTTMVHTMEMSMEGMMEGLAGKTGDEFDQAFLSEMIVHHEGAVAMAEAALVDAKHQEVKDMAKAIIAAQTTEISQMKAWLKAWYNK